MNVIKWRVNNDTKVKKIIWKVEYSIVPLTYIEFIYRLALFSYFVINGVRYAFAPPKSLSRRKQ